MGMTKQGELTSRERPSIGNTQKLGTFEIRTSEGGQVSYHVSDQTL